jgi:hypothetical protein
VDISGWYLSDKRSEPRRWRIPAAVMEPGQFLVFYDSDETGAIDEEHFGSAFSLSSVGEAAYIFSADPSGNLTGYEHGFAFGASENGVSFGRHVNSQAEEHFVAQASLTLGGPNSGPRIGPVVITELMYNPASDHAEFVELMNITDGPVKLFDPHYPANVWMIGGIGFAFPDGVELEPGEIILIVPVEPDEFRARYAIGDHARIFGPYSGNLSNSGERIRLRKPDSPNLVNGVLETPYIDVDVVNYTDGHPWPSEADGFGASLERVFPVAYADDPLNWRSSTKSGGTPGEVAGLPRTSGGFAAWAEYCLLSGPDAEPLADPDNDGIANLLEYAFGSNPRLADAAGLPTVSFSSHQGESRLAISFRRRIGAGDLAVIAQFAPDLEQWIDAEPWQVTAVEADTDGVVEQVTVIDAVPLDQAGRRFARIVARQVE